MTDDAVPPSWMEPSWLGELLRIAEARPDGRPAEDSWPGGRAQIPSFERVAADRRPFL